MSVAVTIPNHYQVLFNKGITHLLQQKGAKIAPHIRTESGEGEAVFFDRMGPTEAQETTTRFGDTPLIIVPHDRRMVTPREKVWATMVDSLDKIRVATDPTSSYMQAGLYSLGRAKDDWVTEGFFDTVYSGRTGDTGVVYDTNQAIAVNSHDYDTGSGNVGMTLSKLQSGNDLYAAAQVDMDEPRKICVSQKQVNDLLSDNRMSSQDYNQVKTLLSGQVTPFLGYEFIPTERLPVNGSGYRRCISWNVMGLLFVTWASIETNLSQRADKNYNFQIWARIQGNCVRMEEKRVLEILCDET